MRNRPSFAVIVLVHAVALAPVADAEPLARFRGSTEGWRGYHGNVAPVERAAADGDGALEIAVALDGRDWSDVTVESPPVNRALALSDTLVAEVRAPADAPSDMKAQLFAKSGATWAWSDAGWTALRPGERIRLALPVSRLNDPQHVRTVGIKIGGNTGYTGRVWLETVGIEPDGRPDARRISVTVTDLVPNSRIAGRVLGLSPKEAGDYKVLVYVRTDKWWLHPYERGGDGLSYAAINADGSWYIQTVRRSFPADFVAAVVVKRSAEAPSPIESLDQLQSVAVYREAGEGRL